MTARNKITLNQEKTEHIYYNIPDEIMDEIRNILGYYTTSQAIKETEEKLKTLKEKLKYYGGING